MFEPSAAGHTDPLKVSVKTEVTVPSRSNRRSTLSEAVSVAVGGRTRVCVSVLYVADGAPFVIVGVMLGLIVRRAVVVSLTAPERDGELVGVAGTVYCRVVLPVSDIASELDVVNH